LFKVRWHLASVDFIFEPLFLNVNNFLQELFTVKGFKGTFPGRPSEGNMMESLYLHVS
jgi:hypothetical protein